MTSSLFKAKNALSAQCYRLNDKYFKEDLHLNHESLRLFFKTNTTFDIDSRIIPISCHRNLYDLNVAENVKLLTSCHSIVSQDVGFSTTTNEMTDNYYKRCVQQYTFNHAFAPNFPSSTNPTKTQLRVGKYRFYTKQNLNYLTMNTHYMLMILDLLGYKNIKVRNHDKFLTKYSIANYMAIINNDLNLHHEFIELSAPSCVALMEMIEVVKNTNFGNATDDDEIVSDFTTFYTFC